MEAGNLQLQLAAAMFQMQQTAAANAAASAASHTIALTPPSENSPDAKPVSPLGEQMELRQFLLQLLQEEGNLHVIRWTNKEEGMFKLVNPQEVARRWGEQTGHPGMNYEKMSRTLRFNYQRKTMQKGIYFQVDKQFEYRFLGLPDSSKKVSPRGNRRMKVEATTPPSTPLRPMQPLQPINLQHLLQMQNIQTQMMLQRAFLPFSNPLFSLLHPPLTLPQPPPPLIPQFSISSILGLTQHLNDQSTKQETPEIDNDTENQVHDSKHPDDPTPDN